MQESGNHEKLFRSPKSYSELYVELNNKSIVLAHVVTMQC